MPGFSAWMQEWLANAAAFTTWSLSMTDPSGSTRTRSGTHLGEGPGERVDPELVGALRIAGRDVAGNPGRQPEIRQQAKSGGQPQLAVPALVRDDFESGGATRRMVRATESQASTESSAGEEGCRICLHLY